MHPQILKIIDSFPKMSSVEVWITDPISIQGTRIVKRGFSGELQVFDYPRDPKINGYPEFIYHAGNMEDLEVDNCNGPRDRLVYSDMYGAVYLSNDGMLHSGDYSCLPQDVKNLIIDYPDHKEDVNRLRAAMGFPPASDLVLKIWRKKPTDDWSYRMADEKGTVPKGRYAHAMANAASILDVDIEGLEIEDAKCLMQKYFVTFK